MCYYQRSFFLRYFTRDAFVFFFLYAARESIIKSLLPYVTRGKRIGRTRRDLGVVNGRDRTRSARVLLPTS